MEKLSILGGGISGISAAYHAEKLGLDYICYEKNNFLGGLVSNFLVDGFLFDNAVHLSFTKSEYVKNIFSKTKFFSHKPNAHCIEKGLWFRYSIQNNLFPLDVNEKISLVKSFINRPSLEPNDYSEWLDHQYGEGIAQRFPKKYTKKYWGCDASLLSTNWVGNRMRRASLDEILFDCMNEHDRNDYYANEMRYPVNGGYFSFIEDISKEINVKLNKRIERIERIDLRRKILFFTDGDKETYDELVSSLPLPFIIDIIDDVPENVSKAAKSLLWTTVDLISVGFSKTNIPPCLWYYIYDENCLASRAYSPSVKSVNNVPKGCSSLQFEIYNLSSKNKYNAEELKDNIRVHLIENNICKNDDIIFMDHKHLAYGNVVFDHQMEERRQIVLEYLKDKNIVTCGRFGEWDYLWSDQSFLSGMRAIQNLHKLRSENE